MTGPMQNYREPWEAFWDFDDPAVGISGNVGYALAAATLAIVGAAFWWFATQRGSAASHVVPSAAEIHVRLPPPK